MTVDRTSDNPHMNAVQKIAAEAFGEVPDALEWYLDLQDIAQVWDNCVDAGDEVNGRQADQVFMALTTRWPLNKWFQEHRASLIPVMVNVIAAWRFSDENPQSRPRAYDIVTEPFCTVAFLIGRQALVDKWSAEIRRLALAACEHNDTHV